MHISVYLCFVSPFKSPLGWLWLVGSIKLWVSFAKEPYRRANILQRRPIILSILLIVATPYLLSEQCRLCCFKIIGLFCRILSLLQNIGSCVVFGGSCRTYVHIFQGADLKFFNETKIIRISVRHLVFLETYCSTLQHTAEHCSTLQCTATHCDTTGSHMDILHGTVAHCNALQHTWYS